MQKITERLLTIEDLMKRWQCNYTSSHRDMYSKSLRAVNPNRKLFEKLKDVERKEET